jgi:hypothetical protein
MCVYTVTGAIAISILPVQYFYRYYILSRWVFCWVEMVGEKYFLGLKNGENVYVKQFFCGKFSVFAQKPSFFSFTQKSLFSKSSF